MNEYDELFTPGMSSKQITMLYFRLCDEVRGNDDRQKALYEAHLRAWRSAEEKEKAAFDKALKEGYILCTN